MNIGKTMKNYVERGIEIHNARNISWICLLPTIGITIICTGPIYTSTMVAFRGRILLEICCWYIILICIIGSTLICTQQYVCLYEKIIIQSLKMTCFYSLNLVASKRYKCFTIASCNCFPTSFGITQTISCL